MRGMRIALIAGALLVPAHAAGGPPFQAGKWEITTTIEKIDGLPGIPAGIPPTTDTRCLTKEQVMPLDPLPPNEGCKKPIVKTEGDAVTWDVRCPDGTARMTITYRGARFDGTTTIRTTGAGGATVMHARLAGKRVGACE